jgi:hypothetical protein
VALFGKNKGERERRRALNPAFGIFLTFGSRCNRAAGAVQIAALALVGRKGDDDKGKR